MTAEDFLGKHDHYKEVVIVSDTPTGIQFLFKLEADKDYQRGAAPPGLREYLTLNADLFLDGRPGRELPTDSKMQHI